MHDFFQTTSLISPERCGLYVLTSSAKPLFMVMFKKGNKEDVFDL